MKTYNVAFQAEIQIEAETQADAESQFYLIDVAKFGEALENREIIEIERMS